MFLLFYQHMQYRISLNNRTIVGIKLGFNLYELIPLNSTTEVTSNPVCCLMGVGGERSRSVSLTE